MIFNKLEKLFAFIIMPIWFVSIVIMMNTDISLNRFVCFAPIIIFFIIQILSFDHTVRDMHRKEAKLMVDFYKKNPQYLEEIKKCK